MKKSLVFALALGLVACGDKPSIAPVAQAAAPKPIAAPAQPVKPDPDRELAKRVARAMEDGKLYGIDAVAAGGIVTLWGTTPNKRERHRAEEIARNVEGVSAVENRLEVVAGS